MRYVLRWTRRTAEACCLVAALSCLAQLGCSSSRPELFGGRLGNGDCYITEEGRIRCRECDEGWGGDRCNECVDPRVCGSRPEDVYNGVVTRSYRSGRNPAWEDGILVGSPQRRFVQELDPVDNGYERAEDARRGIDNRFGVRRNVVRPLSGGEWHVLADGSRVWTGSFRSRGARSLCAVFEGIRLPRGAELWIYTERATHGPVTVEAMSRGVYSTPPLWGDVLHIEVHEPPGSGGVTQIDELGLVHEYGGAAAPPACQTDAACFPAAENQANGIAAIYLHLSGGTFVCSGSLLNTATQQPILLTAEHCLWADKFEYFDYLRNPDQPNPGGQIDFSLSTFVFHYRNRSCEPPVNDDENDIWSALSFSGAEVELHDHETDIGVLRLDKAPNFECVSYLGFDTRRLAPPDYTAGISHPAGKLAKIHVDWDPPDSSNYIDDDETIANSFVEEDTFYKQVLGGDDVGWPEAGSSGSPLFDTKGRVLGQLSGYHPDLGGTCFPGIGFMYGRLSRSVDPDIAPGLVALLGATRLPLKRETATNPLPLYDPVLAPCVGQAHWYTINPHVAEGADIDWELTGAGAEKAFIIELSLDKRRARISYVDFGTGQPQAFRIRITVANPCFEEVREVLIEPTLCM